MSRNVAGIALLLCSASAICSAQTKAYQEIALSGALNSHFETIDGLRTRDYLQLALREAWSRLTPHLSRLEFFAEITPLAVSTSNPNSYDTVSCGGTCYRLVPRLGSVVGAGITPLGLALTLIRARQLSLAVEIAGGGMVFSKPVPDPHAGRFNFTAIGGARLDIELSSVWALSTAYQWQHMSNGGTAAINTGLNTHLARVGVRHLARLK